MSGQYWEKVTRMQGNIETVKIDRQDRIYVIVTEVDAKQSSLYRSSDDGKTWEKLYTFKRIDHFIILDNNKLLITTDKGLALTDIDQFNYHYLPTPFFTSQITDVLELDNKHLFSIDSDYYWSIFKNSLYRSEDGGKNWQLAYHGDVNNIVKFNNQLVLAADRNLILTSINQGKTWKNTYVFHDDHLHIGLSVQNNALVLLRTDGQYISYDLLNWKKINKPNIFGNDTVYVDDKGRIYIIANNAIQYSNNEGKTWKNLLNHIYANGLLSGYHSTVLIAAFSGAGVIKSLDSGKNWELISNGLKDFHFKKLKIIDENNYYLATSQGIFHTINGGKIWIAENQGLENNEVLSLFIEDKLLLAGTNGSGVFKGIKNE